MTDSIGIVSSTIGAANTPNVAASAANLQAQQPPASAATVTTPVSVTQLLHNPRIVQDPTAGFITQYLNASGSEVVSQAPSAIAVAYLRLGLTADGLSKQSVPVTKTA